MQASGLSVIGLNTESDYIQQFSLTSVLCRVLMSCMRSGRPATCGCQTATVRSVSQVGR